MDRITSLISSLKEKRLFPIGVFLLLLIAIPLTLYLVRHQQILRSRAHETGASHIHFFTLANDEITTGQTSVQNIKLGLTYAASSPNVTPTPPAPTFKRVFVTGGTTGTLGLYNGDLKTAGSAKGLGTASTGLDGADKICQSHANAASLGGTWKAWLSGYQVSAASRINPASDPNLGPYKLLDGRTVADNWADLTKGSIQNPISLTEIRTTVTLDDNAAVWTHTATNGSTLPIEAGSFLQRSTPYRTACAPGTIPSLVTNSWSSIDSSVGGGIGLATISSDGQWTNIIVPSLQFISCNSQARLYCFEQGSGTPPAVDPRATQTPTSTPVPTTTLGCGGSGSACGSGRPACCGTAQGYASDFSCRNGLCNSAVATPTPTTRPAATATPAPTSTPITCKQSGTVCNPYSQGNECCTGLFCRNVRNSTGGDTGIYKCNL